MNRFTHAQVLLVLFACQPHSASGPTNAPPVTVPTASASASASASAEPIVTKKWVPPEPDFKPEPSVCKKGVVTECEFWRAALRQVLKFDPPCIEKDAYSFGAARLEDRPRFRYQGETARTSSMWRHTLPRQ